MILAGREMASSSSLLPSSTNAGLFARSLCLLLLVLVVPGCLYSVKAQTVNAGQDLVNAIAAQPQLSNFLLALRTSRIINRVYGDAAKGVTLFAPANDAFNELGTDLLECLLSEPAATDVLTQILLYHIIPGKVVRAEDLQGVKGLISASGLTIPIATEGPTSSVVIDGVATIITPNAITVTNATVHIISAILVPSTIESTLNTECGPTPPSSEAPTSLPMFQPGL